MFLSTSQCKDMLILCMQVLSIQGNMVKFICFGLLMAFVGLEASHHAASHHKRTLLIASAAVIGVSAAVLLAQAAILIRTLHIICAQKKRWWGAVRRPNAYLPACLLTQ